MTSIADTVVTVQLHITDNFTLLNIAEGSLEECRYYLILAQDLGYGGTKSLMGTLEEASLC